MSSEYVRVISLTSISPHIRAQLEEELDTYTYIGYYHTDLSFGEPVFIYRDIKSTYPSLARSLRCDVLRVRTDLIRL